MEIALFIFMILASAISFIVITISAMEVVTAPDKERGKWAFRLFISALVLAGSVAGCINIGTKWDQEEKDACKAKGGTLVDVYRGDLCVSPDGRIIP